MILLYNPFSFFAFIGVNKEEGLKEFFNFCRKFLTSNKNRLRPSFRKTEEVYQLKIFFISARISARRGSSGVCLFENVSHDLNQKQLFDISNINK